MNERIKELAEQAGFETNGAICSFGNYKIDNEYFFAEDFIEDELAKFAELIVKECANIADIAEPFLASDLIKQHFGVKE
jgi:hypothetical protein